MWKDLYAILGVRPYTAIIERWESCGYLTAVKYPGWYLCPSYKSFVDLGDVNDWDEMVWNVWRYLSCVSCVCIFILECAFISFWICRVVVHLGSVLVHAPVWGAWSSMHAVLFVCSCSGAWWCHIQWVCGLWLIIMIRSVSYLIFSDKMSSRVLMVCLSGVCCVFSSFLFMWIG